MNSSQDTWVSVSLLYPALAPPSRKQLPLLPLEERKVGWGFFCGYLGNCLLPLLTTAPQLGSASPISLLSCTLFPLREQPTGHPVPWSLGQPPGQVQRVPRWVWGVREVRGGGCPACKWVPGARTAREAVVSGARTMRARGSHGRGGGARGTRCQGPARWGRGARGGSFRGAHDVCQGRARSGL